MRNTYLMPLLAFFMATGSQAKTLLVVDIGHTTPDVTVGHKLAVLSCQGLMNRKVNAEDEVAVYSIKGGWDQEWLDTTLEEDPSWTVLTLPIEEFMSVCEKEGFPKLLYSKEIHHEVIPQLITAAGALDAVALDVDIGLDKLPGWENHEVVFDAAIEFAGFTELEATEYIFEKFAHLTTGVSMMNPGWKAPDDLHPVQHDLVRDPDVGLADFIIKERIFNFFLWSGCLPTTDQNDLMRRMMSDESTPWPKPVEVYGYNDAIVIFGDIFEAETNCIAEHNMGQIASSGVNNYSFFNRKASIETPDDLIKYLQALQNTRQDIADGKIIYDPTKTYMTFIAGDGDNTAFMKGSRRGWMKDRVNRCQEAGGCRYPIAWSISPHLLFLAPDWVRWFYSKANQTGQDVFVLPPSGHLYAYPGMMNGSVQDNFVRRTQEDCRLLSSTGSVHWEWFYGWGKAFTNYFPKFSTSREDNCIQSFFATNVPYNFPTPIEFPLDEHFAVVGDVVVFQPREWRGTNPENSPPFSDNFFLTEEEMAAEINGYDRGSVSHLYLTSDGGMNLGVLDTMVNLLDEHVKIVNHEELTEMARQKSSIL